MHSINGALFLNVALLLLFASSRFVTVVTPLTTIHASLKSRKCYLNIGVLIPISLLTS